MIGKFSIRIVPDQTPVEVEKLVLAHLDKKWAERNTGNKMTSKMSSGGRSWISDTNDPNYIAGKVIDRTFSKKL